MNAGSAKKPCAELAVHLPGHLQVHAVEARQPVAAGSAAPIASMRAIASATEVIGPRAGRADIAALYDHQAYRCTDADVGAILGEAGQLLLTLLEALAEQQPMVLVI